MSNDIRTALEIIQEEQSIIEAFVDMKNKELLTESIDLCTNENPCINCKCLWCTMVLPSTLARPLHDQLHNKCYYKVIKEWVP